MRRRLTVLALLLCALLLVPRQAGAQTPGPSGITFPQPGTVTLDWAYSCNTPGDPSTPPGLPAVYGGVDPTSNRQEYGYRLNGVYTQLGLLDSTGSCFHRTHAFHVNAGAVLQTVFRSIGGACVHTGWHFAPPEETNYSKWHYAPSGNYIGTVWWEDMQMGCLAYDGDFDDVAVSVSFVADATNTPTPTHTPTRTPTPTPTPWVQVQVRNPQGGAVSVPAVGRVSGDRSGNILSSEAVCANCSGSTFVPWPPVVLRPMGGYAQLSADQVLLGITPDPFWGQGLTADTRHGWGWENFRTGGRTIRIIVATQTPTPTNTPTHTPTPSPTPYLEVYARNPEGAPVAASRLRIDSGATWYCLNCSQHSHYTTGAANAGGGVRPPSNAMVVGVTAEPGGGTQQQVFAETRYTWSMPWTTGGRRITFVLATPTPTNTPTHTPTPTETPTPESSLELPGGRVFVHVYEPGMQERDQADYRTDEPIRLQLQRWAGLAPIFDPESDPLLCINALCYTGVLTTTRFTVTGITNKTGSQPAFEYPVGDTVAYSQRYRRGDTDYRECDHLWLLVLSRGGQMPRKPDGCPQAVATVGYPGTYSIEGQLHMEAGWTLPAPYNRSYTYAWSIPIQFFVVQAAPYPVSPGGCVREGGRR